MDDLHDKDDALIRMIRENGLLTTSPGFTQRLMQLVEEAEKKQVPVFEPLLSRKAWVFISSSVIALLLFCWWAVSGENHAEAVTFKTFQPVIDFMKSLDFSVSINAGAWLIATIAVACMGILLMLDIRLSARYRTSSQ